MKVLSNENLEALQGGILCSQVDDVMRYLERHNRDQFHSLLATYSMFGHGGTYTLQCDEE